MTNGEWRTTNDERRTTNGEWRMTNDESEQLAALVNADVRIPKDAAECRGGRCGLCGYAASANGGFSTMVIGTASDSEGV